MKGEATAKGVGELHYRKGYVTRGLTGYRGLPAQAIDFIQFELLK